MEIGIIILKMVLGIKIMFNIIVKKMKIYIYREGTKNRSQKRSKKEK